MGNFHVSCRPICHEYVRGEDGTNNAPPPGYRLITNADECKTAAGVLKEKYADGQFRLWKGEASEKVCGGLFCEENYPKGCYVNDYEDVYFNTHTTGGIQDSSAPVYATIEVCFTMKM